MPERNVETAAEALARLLQQAVGGPPPPAASPEWRRLAENLYAWVGAEPYGPFSIEGQQVVLWRLRGLEGSVTPEPTPIAGDGMPGDRTPPLRPPAPGPR